MSLKAIVALLMLAGAGVWGGVLAANWFLNVLRQFNSDSVWDDEDDLY